MYRSIPPVSAANAISATPRCAYVLRRNVDAVADAEGGDGALDRTSGC